MKFEYCCFVSYPHGQNDAFVPIINSFVEALEMELYTFTGKKVFVDYKYLESGNWLDKEIGPAICKSACMILFYTPLYFDTEHIYAARELLAMELLEKRRLELLEDKGSGLIIPIIIRGVRKFPEAIKKNRIYYDFSDINHNETMASMRDKFGKDIRGIAEYIIDKCEQLEAIPDLSHNCDDYLLPGEQETRQYVETVLGKKIVDVTVPFFVRE